jgi:hypothetical protein
VLSEASEPLEAKMPAETRAKIFNRERLLALAMEHGFGGKKMPPREMRATENRLTRPLESAREQSIFNLKSSHFIM